MTETTQLITPTSVLEAVWRTSHRLNDVDRLALFDSERSELVILNAVGREVWERIDGKASVEQIVQALLQQTSETPSVDRAEAEVVTFLEDMLRRGAVRVTS